MNNTTTYTTNSTFHVTKESLAELLKAADDLIAKRPKPVVYAISRELFDELSPEHQELYQQFGNHVIDVPGRMAMDVTQLDFNFKQMFDPRDF